MSNENEETRFRSFAERYVVARAQYFRTDIDEMEDAWITVDRAKKIYKHIHAKAIAMRDETPPDAADDGPFTATVKPRQLRSKRP